MIEIKIIPKENILIIIPLLTQLNTKTPLKLLKNRVLEMVNQNYECIGMYVNNKLIGTSGIWYMTRHYIGKSAELDHVIIEKTEQSKGYGRTFMQWIDNHLKSKGVEACELNAYVENKRSHQFYETESYKKYGYHFLKILRNKKEFY